MRIFHHVDCMITCKEAVDGIGFAPIYRDVSVEYGDDDTVVIYRVDEPVNYNMYIFERRNLTAVRLLGKSKKDENTVPCTEVV